MAADLLLLGLLFLMGRGKGKSTAQASGSTPASLLARATQPRAMAWAPYFVDVGESPAVADALARWAGIESGGDPLAVSSLNERGLLQIGPQTQKEGGITAADWADLTNPDTVPNQQARIASNYATWLYLRASKHLDKQPTDSLDHVWYAYLWHQRPKDFTEWGNLVGDPRVDANYLLNIAHDVPNKSLEKHVIACNVVAYGNPGGGRAS